MKYILTILLISVALCAHAQSADYSALMESSQGKACSQDKSWDYVSGLVTKSILKYTGQYPDDALAATAYAWCKAYADNSLNNDGSFKNFKKGSLDNIASGKVLISLYWCQEDKQPGTGAKYKAAADYLYKWEAASVPNVNTDHGPDAIYNLQGIRPDGRSSLRGLYIVNGHKRYIP